MLLSVAATLSLHDVQDKWECTDKWSPSRCAKNVNKGYCAPVSECPSSKGFRCAKTRKYCPVSCNTCPESCADALAAHKLALQKCAAGIDCDELAAIGGPPEKCTDEELQSYSKTLTPCSKDYIVVGAGGAGAPMAYGLATAGCSVTVLEKGPDDTWTGTMEPTVFGPLVGAMKFELWDWETSWMYQANAPHPEISVAYWGEENPQWIDRDYDCAANAKFCSVGNDGVMFNDRRPSDKSMFMVQPSSRPPTRPTHTSRVRAAPFASPSDPLPLPLHSSLPSPPSSHPNLFHTPPLFSPHLGVPVGALWAVPVLFWHAVCECV